MTGQQRHKVFGDSYYTWGWLITYVENNIMAQDSTTATDLGRLNRKWNINAVYQGSLNTNVDHNVHLHFHLSLNRKGLCGTTDDFTASLLHIFYSPLPCGTWRTQACPFLDAVFPPLFLSALSSPFNCALQDGFGQTWRTGDMSTPLQFRSLYDGQEIFM